MRLSEPDPVIACGQQCDRGGGFHPAQAADPVLASVVGIVALNVPDTIIARTACTKRLRNFRYSLLNIDLVEIHIRKVGAEDALLAIRKRSQPQRIDHVDRIPTDIGVDVNQAYLIA